MFKLGEQCWCFSAYTCFTCSNESSSVDKLLLFPVARTCPYSSCTSEGNIYVIIGSFFSIVCDVLNLANSLIHYLCILPSTFFWNKVNLSLHVTSSLLLFCFLICYIIYSVLASSFSILNFISRQRFILVFIPSMDFDCQPHPWCPIRNSLKLSVVWHLCDPFRSGIINCESKDAASESLAV